MTQIRLPQANWYVIITIIIVSASFISGWAVLNYKVDNHEVLIKMGVTKDKEQDSRATEYEKLAYKMDGKLDTILQHLQ